MVQSPSWEPNWFAASQEIPRISQNPKDHYRTHKRPPLVSILGQPNPVHTPTSHLLEIHPNIIHPSTPMPPQWSLSLRFPHQDPIHPPSPHPYAPHAQPISFFSILSPAQYWVRSTNHLASHYAISSIPPVTSSLLGPNILFNTMFSIKNHIEDLTHLVSVLWLINFDADSFVYTIPVHMCSFCIVIIRSTISWIVPDSCWWWGIAYSKLFYKNFMIL